MNNSTISHLPSREACNCEAISQEMTNTAHAKIKTRPVSKPVTLISI